MAEKRYAVLIGSSKYSDKSGLQNLQCPENDVVGLREILAARQFGGFDETVVCVNEPHYAALLRLGEVFERAGSEDLVLIYFSGHGKQDLLGNLYLTTTNTLSKSLSVTSIPVDQLRQLISTSRTKKVVLILDCCYSGAAENAFLKGDAGDELSRVAQEKAKGTYILTASTQIQAAVEKEGDKYGLLTKHIIEGIRGGGAARDDGLVSMDSLYNYVSDQVGDEGPQQPMHWALGAVGDELVIATGGSPTGAARRVRINKLKPELEQALPEDIYLGVVQLVDTPVESLSLEQQPFDRLLDLLLEKPQRLRTFIKKWRLEETLRQTEEQQRKVKHLFSTAREAFARQDLQKAIDSLDELLEIDSNNDEAVKLLCQAREQKELVSLYDEGKAAYNSRRWGEALKAFDQINTLDTSYRDVADLRQHAATAAAEEMIAHSIAAAQQAFKSDNFASAKEELVKLLTAIPSCAEARELLNEIDREQKLSSLYKEGLESIEAEHWVEALDQFNQVRDLDPGYKEVAHFIQFVTEKVAKERSPLPDAIPQVEITNLYETGVRLYNVRRFKEARRLLQYVESKRPNYQRTRDVLNAIHREVIKKGFRIAALIIVASVVLVIGLITVSFIMAPPRPTPNGNQPAQPPVSTANPPVSVANYRDIVGSLAVVTSVDSSGKQNRGIGFFVKEDQLLTAKSLIEDAVNCHVNLTQGTQYEIAKVSGIDPVHQLALLKVEGAKVAPVALGSEVSFSEGDKTNFIRAANIQATSVESATVSLGPDLLSLAGSIAAEDLGGPLLSQQGQVTGIIVKTNSSQNADAAKASNIKTLLDSKQSMMTLVSAGANNRVFDLRKNDERNEANPLKQDEDRIPADLRQRIIYEAFNDANSRQSAKVASKAIGSFTGPGQEQTAYLVDSHAGSNAESQGEKKIVIMPGKRPSAADSPIQVVDAGPFFAIKNATELKKDGVSELLLYKGRSVRGEVLASISLVMIGAGGLEVLADFDGVDDHCNMNSPENPENKYTIAWVLYSSAITSNRWPAFRLDKYVCRCTNLPDGFTYVSSSIMTTKK